MTSVADAVKKMQEKFNPSAAAGLDLVFGFNITDEDTWTERAWIGHIAASMGWEGGIVIVPQEELPEGMRGLGERGQDLWVEASAIRRDLGHRDPFDVPTAMGRTIAWERRHLATDPVDYAEEDAVLAARA